VSPRILLAIIAVCTWLAYLGLRVTAPIDYLAAGQASAPFDWTVNGARLDGRVDGPSGSASRAFRLTATNDDGHIFRQGRPMPPGPATFQVYLRSPERITLRLHLAEATAIARVTTEWRLFSVTLAEWAGGKLTPMVGGGDSFTHGEIVEMADPRLVVGSRPRIADDNSYGLSWLAREVDGLELRRQQGRLLWLAAVMTLVWLFTAPTVRPAWRRGWRWLSAKMSGPRSGLRQALTYVAIVVGTMLAVEVVSFAAAVGIASATLPVRGAVERVWTQALAAPRPAGDLSVGVFAPLTQIRRDTSGKQPIDALRTPYVVNRLGLIDNEGGSAALDVMPEKPSGMVRINLYGGSTAMGIGARDGTETLTSQLERMLNRSAKPGVVFQVLNFGHGGSMTYSDLQFMVSMGSYLEPDVSILLNGFNDAFYATESSLSITPSTYVINWADFSYYFNDVVNGLVPRPPLRIPLLPFASCRSPAAIWGRLSARSSRRRVTTGEVLRATRHECGRPHRLPQGPGRDGAGPARRTIHGLRRASMVRVAVAPVVAGPSERRCEAPLGERFWHSADGLRGKRHVRRRGKCSGVVRARSWRSEHSARWRLPLPRRPTASAS